MSHFRRAASVAVCVWAVAAGSGAAAGDPRALLQALRTTYETTADLSARFVQHSHLVAAGMDRDLEGRVTFKKGGKMRWIYEGDDPQEIVSDGQTLWIHQVRDRTVLTQELASLPSSSRLALDLLSGFEGVESAFELGSCGDRCLELKPREPRPDLARVLVELDEGSQVVRQVTTEDTLGNRTRVELTEVQRNTGVADETFAFKAPEGTQVLQMEAPRP